MAMEMALTNRRMAAAEALQRGLCVEVAPDGKVVEKAVEHASKLAALPTEAIVSTRRLVYGSALLDLEGGLEAEKAEQGRLGTTPEHREGVMAFLEKRPPDFRGAGGGDQRA
jgi:2-(1,2-epoxy-1,2-dihydrophenyl)acetyl-CoA isomerase